MTLIRRASVPAILLYFFISVGCGDTFRPIATPIIQPGGDPQAAANAVVLSNISGAQGIATHVNISGDSNVGQVTLGANPVYATFVASNTRTLVANKGDSTLSSYGTFAPLAGPPGTITLPQTPPAAPVYLFTNQPTVMFVAYSGRNSVGVVDLAQNIATGEIPVGTQPVALTGSSDGARLYVANSGSNTVTVINATNSAILGTPVAVGSSPSWMAITADNRYVYVANAASNNVSVIDTKNDANTVTNVAVGATPNFLVFDPRNLRVYVTNSGGNTVSIINADSNSPTLNAVTSVTVGTAPISVTPLADGSRAYVANSGSDSVTVINTLNNGTKTIALGAASKPISLGSSTDSTRVVVANSGNGSISIIRTSDDTVVPPQNGATAGTLQVVVPAGVVVKPTFVAVTR